VLPAHFYFAILAACCVYATLRGAAPERFGAAIFVVASILSFAVVSSPSARFGSLEVGVFAVDATVLVSLLVLALRAERFWPLWAIALHLIETAGHAVKAIDPLVIPKAYAFVLAFWSYPMLALLVLGTWNHQKRLAKNGVDKSWSTSSGRWDRRPPDGPIS
jgi:hypothetical protein